LVFAKRVIESCKIDVKRQFENYDLSENKVWEYKIDNSLVTDFIKVKNKIATLLNNNAGIVRNNDLLTDALLKQEEIEFYESDEFEYYSFRIKSILQISEMIIKSALLRKESRGTHQRSDFTNLEMKFLGNFIFNINSEPYFKPLNNSYEN
jgi:L-aspartate oxidase